MNRPFILLFLLLVNTAACSGGNQADQSSSEEKAPATSTKAQALYEPPAEGKLDYIEEFIGRRPAAVGLWQSEPLRDLLQQLLGEDLNFYLDVMQEAMPLKKDRVIYTVGVAPDDHVPGVGYLLIDTEREAIRAYAVFGDMEIDQQTNEGGFYVPETVLEKVREVLNR